MHMGSHAHWWSHKLGIQQIGCSKKEMSQESISFLGLSEGITWDTNPHGERETKNLLYPTGIQSKQRPPKQTTGRLDGS